MLVRLLVNTIALLVVFFVVWGVRGGNDVVITALVMAVILAVINAFIRPVLLLLTLPLSVLTLGLFALVLNALLFYIAARVVHVNVGFWQAFLGYIVFVVITAALNHVGLTET